MIIQNVKVRFKNGETMDFEGVGQKKMNVIAPGLPVIMEFMSALDISLGAVVLEPGMGFVHTNHTATTSQVADNGMIEIPSENEDE